MTKIINSDPDYIATPSVYTAVGAAIHPWSHQNIAASQARVYEVLTNQESDGAGSVTAGNDAHVHTNEGSFPMVPLVSQSWGSEAWAIGDQYDTGTGVGTQRPYRIDSLSTSPADDNVVALYVPFFVPTGLAGKTLLVVLRCEGNPKMSVTLATWSGAPKTPTNVSGSAYLTLQYGNRHPDLRRLADKDMLWWARVVPATDGVVMTLCFRTATNPAWEFTDGRELRSLTVVPEMRGGHGVPNVPVPELPTANRVDVGDSRRSNAWTPPSDALYPYDATTKSGPIGPGVRFSALNDAWLQEKALGIPAAGQKDLTVSAGHNHDGTAGNGAEIEIPLGAFPLGRWNNRTGTAASATVDAANDAFTGNGTEAPTTNDAAYKQVLEFEFYTPAHTYALDSGTAGHERLYCAALMYSEASKASACVTKVTTTSTGTTSVEYASDATTEGYELVLSSSAFNFASQGRTKVTVEIKRVGAGGGACSLIGICFWLAPP